MQKNYFSKRVLKIIRKSICKAVTLDWVAIVPDQYNTNDNKNLSKNFLPKLQKLNITSNDCFFNDFLNFKMIFHLLNFSNRSRYNLIITVSTGVGTLK